MTTIQIVIITILVIVGAMAFISWLNRSLDMQDDLYIEWVVIAVVVLFVYLVAR